MEKLLKDIQTAQRDAAEHAVMGHLQELGFNDLRGLKSAEQAPAAGSIADDPEFKKLASDLWASRQDSMLAAFNDLARYIDGRLKGSK